MSKCKGFTLVELLVSLAVLGIVLMLGVPSFQSTVISRRLDSAASQVLNAMNVARSEAARRGVQVSVQAADTNWNSGWRVVLADGTVLQAFDGAVNTALTDIETITFQPTGIRADANGASFTLRICDTTSDDPRGIQFTVNIMGGVTRSAIASNCAV